jgi:hypothetical protein
MSHSEDRDDRGEISQQDENDTCSTASSSRRDDDALRRAKSREQEEAAGEKTEGLQRKGLFGRPVVPAFFDPKDLTKVPGVIGELIEWVVKSALYPNRSLAVGTALLIVTMLMGRRVEGPTKGGTQLYVIGIAPTATGKQHQMDCAKAALRAAGAEDRIGPDDIRSSVGLVGVIEKRKVFLSLIDEFGNMLERSTGSDSNSWGRDTFAVLRKLWGLHRTWYDSPVAARKDSIPIWWPYVCVGGFGTPPTVFGAMLGSQAEDGLLNRLLFIEGDPRPLAQHDRVGAAWEVPERLAARLKVLYPLVAEPVDGSGPQVKLTFGSPGAQQMVVDLERELLHEERDQLKRNLFNRVPEMIVRIATIAAYGRFSRTVDEADMEWAKALVMKSARTLHAGYLKYREEPLSLNRLCIQITDWLEAEKDGCLTKNEVARRARPLIRKGLDLKDAIHQLEQEEERIKVEWNRQTGGRPSCVLRLIKD